MKKSKDTTARHYIDNKQFLAAMIEYKQMVDEATSQGVPKPQVPEYVGECLIKIANQLAFKGNFINYSFREDMILDAIENCLTYIDNFDPAKSSNPFAYFTQITYYAFIRRIQKEKRQLQTKYKYIESLDIDSIITQVHDEGEYANSFVTYLKKQADIAQQEMTDIKSETKIKRTPKYLQKSTIDEVEELVEQVEDLTN
jgi:DNA-directed RNA polymerase specialized sigma24 family protein